MLKGWFDAFRSEGGPTLYSVPNRTPVTEDVRNVIVYVSFATIFVAFLIVFPGIRKEKFSTFVSVTISLFLGAVILISNCGSEWHVARATVSGVSYRAFSREKISADVGVKVGLDSVNITLRAAALHRRSEVDINYNERFRWVEATDMKLEYRAALVKGLPFPLLTVAEYFTQELEGFCWGRRYRLAGYYSHILLWSAFALWLLMNVLLCTVPRYGAYTMQLTGVLMLASNAVYAHLLPRRPLVIPFEGAALHFSFGWCFWLLMAAGVTAIAVGGAVAAVDLLFPNKFATILEVDYGMPCSRWPTTAADRVRSCSSSSSGGSGGRFENAAYCCCGGEDDGHGYATVVDGKRAVTLGNFGRFVEESSRHHHHQQQQQQQQQRGGVGGGGRRHLHAFTSDTTYLHHHHPSTKEVNIDISAAALW